MDNLLKWFSKIVTASSSISDSDEERNNSKERADKMITSRKSMQFEDNVNMSNWQNGNNRKHFIIRDQEDGKERNVNKNQFSDKSFKGKQNATQGNYHTTKQSTNGMRERNDNRKYNQEEPIQKNLRVKNDTNKNGNRLSAQNNQQNKIDKSAKAQVSVNYSGKKMDSTNNKDNPLILRYQQEATVQENPRINRFQRIGWQVKQLIPGRNEEKEIHQQVSKSLRSPMATQSPNDGSRERTPMKYNRNDRREHVKPCVSMATYNGIDGPERRNGRVIYLHIARKNVIKNKMENGRCDIAMVTRNRKLNADGENRPHVNKNKTSHKEDLQSIVSTTSSSSDDGPSDSNSTKSDSEDNWKINLYGNMGQDSWKRNSHLGSHQQGNRSISTSANSLVDQTNSVTDRCSTRNLGRSDRNKQDQNVEKFIDKKSIPINRFTYHSPEQKIIAPMERRRKERLPVNRFVGDEDEKLAVSCGGVSSVSDKYGENRYAGRVDSKINNDDNFDHLNSPTVIRKTTKLIDTSQYNQPHKSGHLFDDKRRSQTHSHGNKASQVDKVESKNRYPRLLKIQTDEMSQSLIRNKFSIIDNDFDNLPRDVDWLNQLIPNARTEEETVSLEVDKMVTEEQFVDEERQNPINNDCGNVVTSSDRDSQSDLGEKIRENNTTDLGQRYHDSFVSDRDDFNTEREENLAVPDRLNDVDKDVGNADAVDITLYLSVGSHAMVGENRCSEMIAYPSHKTSLHCDSLIYIPRDLQLCTESYSPVLMVDIENDTNDNIATESHEYINNCDKRSKVNKKENELIEDKVNFVDGKVMENKLESTGFNLNSDKVLTSPVYERDSHSHFDGIEISEEKIDYSNELNQVIKEDKSFEPSVQLSNDDVMHSDFGSDLQTVENGEIKKVTVREDSGLNEEKWESNEVEIISTEIPDISNNTSLERKRDSSCDINNITGKSSVKNNSNQKINYVESEENSVESLDEDGSQIENYSSDYSSDTTIGEKRGFRNPQGFSSLNSILQVLRCCKKFHKAFLVYHKSSKIVHSKETEDKMIFVNDFCKLFENLKGGVSVSKQLKNIQEFFKSFGDGDDVYKCFMRILTVIHDVSKESKPRSQVLNSRSKYEKFQDEYTGFVFDCFYGEMRYSVHCERCDEVFSTTYQLIKCLPVPVLESERQNTLNHCIDAVFEKSKIEGYEAVSCKCPIQGQSIVSKCEITHSPLYLFVYLNRGSFTDDEPKKDTFIRCKERIVIKTAKGDVDYQLISVMDHLGTNKDGHYYCKCNYEANEWWLLNDTQSMHLWNSSIGDIISKSTIAFMFKKILQR